VRAFLAITALFINALLIGAIVSSVQAVAGENVICVGLITVFKPVACAKDIRVCRSSEDIEKPPARQISDFKVAASAAKNCLFRFRSNELPKFFSMFGEIQRRGTGVGFAIAPNPQILRLAGAAIVPKIKVLSRWGALYEVMRMREILEENKGSSIGRKGFPVNLVGFFSEPQRIDRILMLNSSGSSCIYDLAIQEDCRRDSGRSGDDGCPHRPSFARGASIILALALIVMGMKMVSNGVEVSRYKPSLSSLYMLGAFVAILVALFLAIYGILGPLPPYSV
jgi:hypothetical protein